MMVTPLLLVASTLCSPGVISFVPSYHPLSKKHGWSALAAQDWGVIEIIESDFQGAGQPRADLDPEDLPSLLMEALENNDFPTVDAGLISMWAFASETTRYIFSHNETDFIESAHETAREFSTSFYGNALRGQKWSMETELNRVGGEDGWIATQVMKTISSDGRLRRWQWELRKHRRPPHSGCWYVESIGSSGRKGNFEPD